jgi:hypothetical protein
LSIFSLNSPPLDLLNSSSELNLASLDAPPSISICFYLYLPTMGEGQPLLALGVSPDSIWGDNGNETTVLLNADFHEPFE